MPTTRSPSFNELLGPGSITLPSVFLGIDGIFRFTGNGLVERGLAVYEFHKGGAKLIDPAPQSFEALTQ